ncbi:MAG: hypothetical protein ACYCUM_09885 [Solirubrobacteraceae bacterium]
MGELHADDVDEYIKAGAGEAFSAKDFRTWNATVLAAVELAAIQARRSRISQTIAAALPRGGLSPPSAATHAAARVRTRVERAVIDLLGEAER